LEAAAAAVAVLVVGLVGRDEKYEEVGAIGDRSGVEAADATEPRPGNEPGFDDGVMFALPRLNSFRLSRFPSRELLDKLIGPRGSAACRPNNPIFESPKSVSLRCPR
jgi:hypothetical protein